MALLGHEQLEANLKRLPEKCQKTVVRGALSAAARVLAQYQRRVAPVGPTGTLKGAIGSRVMARRGQMIAKAGINVGRKGWQGLQVVNVGNAWKSGAKKRRRGALRAAKALTAAPHAHLVGLGTKPRFTRGSGPQTGWEQVGTKMRAKRAGAGAFRGTMPRNDFIHRAFAAGQGPALFAMRERIAKGVGREWSKLQKKIGGRY
jgi:hypothetical protein